MNIIFNSSEHISRGAIAGSCGKGTFCFAGSQQTVSRSGCPDLRVPGMGEGPCGAASSPAPAGVRVLDLGFLTGMQWCLLVV